VRKWVINLRRIRREEREAGEGNIAGKKMERHENKKNRAGPRQF
jgi:hypothetical protein